MFYFFWKSIEKKVSDAHIGAEKLFLEDEAWKSIVTKISTFQDFPPWDDLGWAWKIVIILYIVFSSCERTNNWFFDAHSREGNVKTSISSFLLTFRLNPQKKTFSALIWTSLTFFSIHFQNKWKIFILFNFFTDEYVSTNCEKNLFFY